MKRNDFRGKVKSHAMLLLSTVMALSFVSCGKNDQGASSTDSEQKDYVYVPEYITLNEEDGVDYYSTQLVGNSMYNMCFTFDEETMDSDRKIVEYSLDTNEKKEVALNTSEERDIGSWVLDKEKNFYTIEYSWGEFVEDEMPDQTQFLCKYDSQGNQVYEQDITKIMEADENNSWISEMVSDDQGRIYLASDSLIRLFDANGAMQGEVDLSNRWISGMGTGKDGKVYISCYDETSVDGGFVLTEVDFDGKKLGQTYSNFPGGNGNGGLSIGIEKDFLVSDSSKVYEYDLATQTYEELFAWLDCDINGNYVSYVGATQDGKVLAVVQDWNSGKSEMAYLTRKSASEVAQKQELLIGTLYENQELQEAAVNFNKNNDAYRVRIKTYIDTNNWTETSWQDGITALNNDILSKSNCPDILDLSSLNVEQLAVKGVLEDITPYLEKSSALNKEDYLECIIDGYTINGKLVSVPSTFTLSTIAGKTADVGAEMGWTMDEMMAYAKKYPNASLFDGYTKEDMIYMMMVYNQSVFINWETGECNFDSEEFKQLLMFVNTLPDEYDWESDERSTPVKIQAGEVLMDFVGIYDLDSIQEYEAKFNEPVTFIGFPNADGNCGCYISADGLYGISTKSGNKDAAWAFIESYLVNSADSDFSWGLSTNKKILEERIAEATKVEYVLDENGQPILDENGEPIQENAGHGVDYGDWEYTYHVPTEEEVAKIMELVEVAVPVFNADEAITNIVKEEAPAYFQGQKSVEDVAGVIQSRVQLYVNENR